jgi:hypothetical protein
MQRTEMTREIKIACCIGAMAGITPLMVSLVSVDAEMIVEEFVPTIFIGYMIKAIGLMVLGAFVVFVNSESDFKKAFQLGLMAPALVVGTINASNFNEAKQEIRYLESELGTHESANRVPKNNTTSLLENHGFGFSIISSAYAGDQNALIGKHNKPSAGRQIWYGISGKISDCWFVIVDSYNQESDARSKVRQLNSRGYDARVVKNPQNSDIYGVAIGSRLTLREAQEIQKQAFDDGLHKESYLLKWK